MTPVKKRILITIIFVFGAWPLSPVYAEQHIHVAAASSLFAFLPEFKMQFEKLYPYQLKISLASSGQLYRQIEAGAPFDVFISAHMRYVTALAQKERILSHFPLATAHIALYRRDMPITNNLTNLQVKGPLLIPHPEIAPFGIAAKEYLQNTGNWEHLGSHLILGNSAMHTTQMAKAGAATYAILPLQSAKHLAEKNIGFYTVIPNHLHSPILYTWVAINRQSTASNRFALEALNQFLQSDTARKLMETHSLIPHSRSLP